MTRMYPIPGTKERVTGRWCLMFRVANYGPVIVDGVHPDEIDATFARLWAEHGKGAVWVQYRRMWRGEAYTETRTGVAS